MGTNQSWLSLPDFPGTIEAVADAIIASYSARGVPLLKRVFDPGLRRSTVEDEPAPLGVCIASSGATITIADSFGYSTDARLAADLAKRLNVTVFRETVADVANYEATERFGPARRPVHAGAELRYEKDAEYTYLVFGNVTEANYDAGSRLTLHLQCTACDDARPWEPGYELPTTPAASQLFALGPARPGEDGSLLFEMACSDCQGVLGWGAATLVEGVVMSVRKLPRAPARPRSFDFALERQRERVETTFPGPKQRQAQVASRAFARRVTSAPRGALEGELAEVLSTVASTKPPLLGLRFAETDEALIVVVTTDFPSFEWGAADLRTRVDLQLVSWLGPDPNAPRVQAFLGEIKKLLTPGAFARQGRAHTGRWITAIYFPLPDSSWVALVLCDTFRAR